MTEGSTLSFGEHLDDVVTEVSAPSLTRSLFGSDDDLHHLHQHDESFSERSPNTCSTLSSRSFTRFIYR